MTLAFPNPSRSYDRTRNAVRFAGYDGMREIAFYVDAAVIRRVLAAEQGAEAAEAALLRGFDDARGAIQDAARRVYGGSRRPFYLLTAADFA